MSSGSSSCTAPPNMSPATKQLLARVRQMIPPMLEKFHKGQLGRVGVIGGSEDYTGAPYFSAMASARLGCDMSHIICTPAAATVIKSYSPNLMVHPLMRSSSPEEPYDPGKVASTIVPLLDRLHVLVVGPGLGRDPLMQETCARVVRVARARGLPLVLDADALLLVGADPELVRGYGLAVITPNVVEFGRLGKALGIKEGEGGVEGLARALEGVLVVEKGAVDRVSDGRETVVVDLEGGRKRSGGQGDTLTGSIATFLAWRKAYAEGLWEHGGKLEEGELVRLAAIGGCAITRECSRLAFAKRGRSLQASDLTEEVHTAFLNVFGEVDDDDRSGARL